METLIYGEIDGALAFMPRAVAEERRKMFDALSECHTFAEMRAIASDEIAERYDDSEPDEETPNFPMFQRLIEECGENMTQREAWERYCALDPLKRQPIPSDPFPPSWEIAPPDPRDGPYWPFVEMLQWMPEELQAHGHVVGSVHSHAELHFHRGSIAWLRDDFERLGYVCEKNEELLRRACGFPPSSNGDEAPAK